MASGEVIQVPVLNEKEELGDHIISQLHIKVSANGGIDIFVPDDSRQLNSAEVEDILFFAHKRLYENRIAQLAVDIFKARLG